MINISWRWICANVSDWIEAVTSLLIYHLVSVCAHKKRKEQLFYCFLSPNRGVTFVLRESTRQIERLLSFLFSSWLLVVLQQRVGRRMWQEPLGWEMTVKSGPTFRARTEESLNNHMHSNTTHIHTVEDTCICTRAAPNAALPTFSPCCRSSESSPHHTSSEHIQAPTIKSTGWPFIRPGFYLRCPCEPKRAEPCRQKERGTWG